MCASQDSPSLPTVHHSLCFSLPTGCCGNTPLPLHGGALRLLQAAPCLPEAPAQNVSYTITLGKVGAGCETNIVVFLGLHQQVADEETKSTTIFILLELQLLCWSRSQTSFGLYFFSSIMCRKLKVFQHVSSLLL